jgi:Nucleotidyltransferase domain
MRECNRYRSARWPIPLRRYRCRGRPVPGRVGVTHPLARAVTVFGPVYRVGVVPLGSARHRVLIDRVVEHYRGDGRIRAVAVFGSVSAGTWHELSDVDLDVVIGEGVAIEPAVEAATLFGPKQ